MLTLVLPPWDSHVKLGGGDQGCRSSADCFLLFLFGEVRINPHKVAQTTAVHSCRDLERSRLRVVNGDGDGHGFGGSGCAVASCIGNEMPIFPLVFLFQVRSVPNQDLDYFTSCGMDVC